MRANHQEWLYNEPMRTIIDCLQTMASVDVQTCAGPVEVYCEHVRCAIVLRGPAS